MWTAPGPTWRPPSWAPMPAPVAAIDPEIPAETFTAPVVDDVADEAEDDEPEPAAPTPPQADALDLAEWEGTEDQLAEVIAIVLDLRQRQGKTPHVNAVSYHLRRANLPTVTTKQIEAICTRGAP